MEKVNLNTAQANLHNIPVPDILNLGDLPPDILVNFVGSILTMGTFIVGDIVSAMGAIGDFSVINGAVQLGLLFGSLIIRFAIGISKLDFSKASNYILFITSLTCDTLKGYLFLTNLLELPPESSPEILGIITSVSMISDFVQSIQMFQIINSI